MILRMGGRLRRWQSFRKYVVYWHPDGDQGQYVGCDGATESVCWQVNAFDDSSRRLSSGKIGVWSYYSGDKYWYDLGVQPLGN